MAWLRIRHLATGEEQTVALGDGQQLGDVGMDPAAFEVVAETEQFELAAPEAEAEALGKIDNEQTSAELGEGRRLARIVSTLAKWAELQDLKTVEPAAVGAMTALARAPRWPFLTALVQESGATLTQVAGTVEQTLWPPVRRIALFEARAELARRAVRQATSAAEKLAAASGINWLETE
jgi:hypothetical protein